MNLRSVKKLNKMNQKQLKATNCLIVGKENFIN